MITTIISGGQSGVDRAALDVALELGIPCRGWCPKGRRAEDGPIDQRYPLTETPTAAYEERTESNVHETDGTLILRGEQSSLGTEYTIQLAAGYGKPCMVVELFDQPDPATVRQWANEHQIRVLNVAGPRESQSPGIYDRARAFLRQVLRGGDGHHL
jgi:hypothetical protein